MYINPFWAGVIATIFAELSTLLIVSIITAGKRG